MFTYDSIVLLERKRLQSGKTQNATIKTAFIICVILTRLFIALLPRGFIIIGVNAHIFNNIFCFGVFSSYSPSKLEL